MLNTTARRSQWLVIGLTALALLAGWTLRSTTLSRTRPVEENGLLVQIPDHWVVETAGGGLNGQQSGRPALSAWDPLSPGTRYLATLLPAQADASLATVASFHNLQRAQSETAYRILEQTPVTLDGREGYRVLYAFVDASETGEIPVIYRGVDYYFFDGDDVIVATLETRHDFDAELNSFRSFAATAQSGDAP